MQLAEHWGQNKSLYDIGLSPLGDGVVDANDLTVLVRYIGRDVNDPTLIAHWALDETEGMTAADSARDDDATVLGDAVWQPAGGKISGALAFDGTAGFLRTGSAVLNDQWRRVVLAWDGTNRTLQMDGVEVARDTQPNLAASSGVLQIGCGKYVAPTTLWSGLIDDVRVYNRAVAT